MSGAVKVFLAVLIGLCTYINGSRKENKKKRSDTVKSTDKEKNSKIAKKELWLSKTGANYILKHTVKAVNYFFFQAVCAVVCVILVFLLLKMKISLFHGILMAIAGIIGYFFPDIVLKYSNKTDNDDMLADIKKIYDMLRIQTKAGVFVTATLAECHKFVKNRRLKKALYELSAGIAARNEIDGPFQDFGNKFDNRYIDTLVITIRQSLKTGTTVQMLTDISKQMADVEKLIAARETSRTQMRILMYQLAVYLGILAIVIYSLAPVLMGVFEEF